MARAKVPDIKAQMAPAPKVTIPNEKLKRATSRVWSKLSASRVSVGVAQMPVGGLPNVPITLDGMLCIAIMDTGAKVSVLTTELDTSE